MAEIHNVSQYIKFSEKLGMDKRCSPFPYFKISYNHLSLEL